MTSAIATETKTKVKKKRTPPIPTAVPHLKYDLYDYQKRAIAQLDSLINKYGRKISVLINKPTGAGKTMTFCELLARECSQGKRGMVLTHTKNLLDQSVDNLAKNAFIVATKKRDKFLEFPQSFHVLTMNIQALDERHVPREELDLLIAEIDFLVIDECHHYTAPAYIETIQYFKDHGNFPVVGFSATPKRTDNVPLNSIFAHLISSKDTRCTVPRLMVRKKLSEYEKFEIVAHKNPDFDLDQFDREQAEKTGRETEEYSAEAVKKFEAEVDLDQVIEKSREHFRDRKTLVFTSSIAMSKALTQKLIDAGFSAVHVDGTLSDKARKEAFEGFASGKYQFLLNCFLISEGFDVPGAEVLILLKPTKSVISFLQMVGRVLRYVAGKMATVLDFCKAFQTHGSPEDPKNNEWAKYFKGKGSHDCEACGGSFLPKREELEPVEERIEVTDSGRKIITKIYRVTCPHCGHVMEKETEVKNRNSPDGEKEEEEFTEKRDLQIERTDATLRVDYLKEVYAIADEIEKLPENSKLNAFSQMINASTTACLFTVDEALELTENCLFLDEETENKALGIFLARRIQYCDDYLDFMRFIGSSYSPELRVRLWGTMDAPTRAEVRELHKAFVSMLTDTLFRSASNDEYKECVAGALDEIPTERRGTTKKGVWVNFIRELALKTLKAETRQEVENMWLWVQKVVFPGSVERFQKLRLDVWNSFSPEQGAKIRAMMKE